MWLNHEANLLLADLAQIIPGYEPTIRTCLMLPNTLSRVIRLVTDTGPMGNSGTVVRTGQKGARRLGQQAGHSPALVVHRLSSQGKGPDWFVLAHVRTEFAATLHAPN